MKNQKFLMIIMLIMIIIISSCVFYILNKYFTHDGFYFEQTMNLYNAKEIKFDENYVVNVAIIVYKQLYGKEYSADDFIVSDTGKFGSSNWNVFLDKPFDGVIYDGGKGLVINKKNGAIVMNLGE